MQVTTAPIGLLLCENHPIPPLERTHPGDAPRKQEETTVQNLLVLPGDLKIDHSNPQARNQKSLAETASENQLHQNGQPDSKVRVHLPNERRFLVPELPVQQVIDLDPIDLTRVNDQVDLDQKKSLSDLIAAPPDLNPMIARRGLNQTTAPRPIDPMIARRGLSQMTAPRPLDPMIVQPGLSLMIAPRPIDPTIAHRGLSLMIAQAVPNQTTGPSGRKKLQADRWVDLEKEPPMCGHKKISTWTIAVE